MENNKSLIAKVVEEFNIPVDELLMEKGKAKIVLKEHEIGEIDYLEKDEACIFDFNDESYESIKWRTVFELEFGTIEELVKKYIKIEYKLINPDDFPNIKLYDDQNNMLFSFMCLYNGEVWQLNQDLKFELDRRDNEITNLKQQLSNSNSNADQKQYLNQDGQIINALATKGLEFGMNWLGNQSKNDKRQIEMMGEFEKQELSVVNTLDKRDKIFKGVILSVCLILMALLAYFEKASTVLPIIGVIIGLVLQNDAMSKYYSGSSKKKGSDFFDNEE